MSSKESSRKIISLARQGRLDGEQGLKTMVVEAQKMNLLDIDYNEKPYFRTALWEATWKNNEAIVKYLTEKGASVSYADYQGRTPLHEAAYYGHVNLVEYFLDKGALMDATDIFGQSPIFRAIDGGRHEIVKILVERKAQTNLLDTDDVNPHHIAAFGGMPQMAHWLVYKGAWRNRFSIEEGTSARLKAEAKAVAAEAAEKGEEDGDPVSPKEDKKPW